MPRPTAIVASLALLAASCSPQDPASGDSAPSETAEREPAENLAARPVMVGGEPGLDACAGAAVVSNLDPGGDNFLAVRAGAGPEFAETDRLESGQRVTVCDLEGEWLGVVYSRDGVPCGLSSPQEQRAAYRGPCASGWVSSKFVTIVAG